MEIISSRKNKYIRHLKDLASDREYREQTGEYVGEGGKLLAEAIAADAEVTSVLLRQGSAPIRELAEERQFYAAPEIFDYASTMQNSPGPIFTVRTTMHDLPKLRNAIVLENVQDPGNIGTVIRTAAAFNIDAVILVGDCADCKNPKTVRATMGAVFRQNVVSTDCEGLKKILKDNNLPLYGAALSERAGDIRVNTVKNAAYAIGSEGNGLTEEFLRMCDKQVIIPMNPCSESLNAAVAASVIMWIISGQDLHNEKSE